MNLTAEQLGSWFFTAFQLAGRQFPAEREAHWREMLAASKGKERSQLVSGMKQGINDTLTMAKWWPDDQRKKIEDALAAKGLPSIRKMEAVLKKKHQRILKRGEIKNDEEFYLVAEILSDTEFEVSAADRRSLGKMSAAYEAKAK